MIARWRYVNSTVTASIGASNETTTYVSQLKKKKKWEKCTRPDLDYGNHSFQQDKSARMFKFCSKSTGFVSNFPNFFWTLDFVCINDHASSQILPCWFFLKHLNSLTRTAKKRTSNSMHAPKRWTGYTSSLHPRYPPHSRQRSSGVHLVCAGGERVKIKHRGWSLKKQRTVIRYFSEARVCVCREVRMGRGVVGTAVTTPTASYLPHRRSDVS